MDFEPTDEQRLIVGTVRRFVREEIVPLEAELDPDASELPAGGLATASWRRSRRWGSTGLDIPAEYGGAGHRPRHAHADGDRDVAAPRRPLRAVLRRVRRRRARPALRGQRGPEGALSLSPRCAARSAASSASPSPPAAATRRAPSAPRPCATATTGSSTAPRCSSPAPTGRSTASSSRAPTPRGPRRHHLLHRRHRHAGLPRAPRRPHAALRATTRPSCQFENMRVPNANVLGKVNGGFAIANDRAVAPAHPLRRRLHRPRHPRAGDGDRVRHAARDLRRRCSPPARRSSG